MAFQRCRTKSELEEYLRALRDPKTPADWVIVLSDPRSLQYQIMMNLIREKVEMEFFTIKLLDHWAEIDEEIKQQRVAEIREQEENSRLITNRALQTQSNPVQLKALQDKPIAELEKLLHYYVKKQAKMDLFEKDLLRDKEKIHADMKQYNVDWDKWQDACSKVFIDKLTEMNVTESALEKVNFKRASVVTLADKIPALNDKIVKSSDTERKEIAGIMAKIGNVVNELNFSSALNKTGIATGLLTEVNRKENKQAFLACLNAIENLDVYQPGAELVVKKNENINALKEIKVQIDYITNNINYVSKLIEQSKHQQPAI